jgi:hypothetical protein
VSGRRGCWRGCGAHFIIRIDLQPVQVCGGWWQIQASLSVGAQQGVVGWLVLRLCRAVPPWAGRIGRGRCASGRAKQQHRAGTGGGQRWWVGNGGGAASGAGGLIRWRGWGRRQHVCYGQQARCTGADGGRRPAGGARAAPRPASFVQRRHMFNGRKCVHQHQHQDWQSRGGGMRSLACGYGARRPRASGRPCSPQESGTGGDGRPLGGAASVR